jgi:hypothetical protein
VKSERDKFLRALSYLHGIEEANDLETTIVYPTKGSDLVIIGDKFWQSSVWTISLYSFLLRYLAYNEDNYLNQIGSKNWTKLTMGLKEIKKATSDPTGWDTQNIDQIHNGSGFVSLFREGFQGNNKYREAFNALS